MEQGVARNGNLVGPIVPALGDAIAGLFIGGGFASTLSLGRASLR